MIIRSPASNCYLIPPFIFLLLSSNIYAQAKDGLPSSSFRIDSDGNQITLDEPKESGSTVKRSSNINSGSRNDIPVTEKSNDYLLKLAIIRRSERYSDEFIPSDREVLASARKELHQVYYRSIKLIEETCRRFLRGDYAGDDMAVEFGRVYSLSEEYERQDSIEFFNDVISGLSPQGAELLSHKSTLGSTSNKSIDYISYAQADPERFLEEMGAGCNRMGVPGEF